MSAENTNANQEPEELSDADLEDVAGGNKGPTPNPTHSLAE